MLTKTQRILGWVLSGLIAAFLIFGSAVGKFVDFPGKAELFEKLGWSVETIKIIGGIEILIAALYLIPRAGFIGSILLTAYLGGATATHVRIAEDWYFSVVLGVLAWVGYGLRNPVVFRLAVGAKPSA